MTSFKLGKLDVFLDCWMKFCLCQGNKYPPSYLTTTFIVFVDILFGYPNIFFTACKRQLLQSRPVTSNQRLPDQRVPWPNALRFKIEMDRDGFNPD